MSLDRRGSILAVITCMALVPIVALHLVAADELPNFSSKNDREDKEFITKIGMAIVKAARSSPRKLELVDFTYTTPKPDRKQLSVKMNYSGAVTRVKFKVEITLLLDTKNDDKWKVLSIRYSDSNKSPIPYSERKVQSLIKKLNE